MPNYVCVFRSAFTDTPYGELAVSNLAYGFALNGFGTFSFDVAMDDPAGNPFRWTAPNKFVVCIERDGTLVYSGIIWQRQLDYTKRTITVGGNEWGSVFVRHLLGDVPWDGATVKDILDILLRSAAATIPLPPTTSRFGGGGNLDNVIYGAFSEADQRTVYDGITTLSQSDADGFSYRWVSQYDGTGHLQRYLFTGDALGTTTPAIADFYAPGGGGTIDTLVVDERDSPNRANVYSYDGYRVATVQIDPLAPADDQPIYSGIGYAFSSDYTDDQAFDIAFGRFSAIAAEGSTDPSTKIWTLGVVNPAHPGILGVEGDALWLDIQRRAVEAPARVYLFITARDITTDANGIETLSVTANTGSSGLSDGGVTTGVQRTFGF